MKIILLGDGGHSRVVQEMIFSTKTHTLLAVLDDKYEQEFHKQGIIFGPFSILKKLLGIGTKIVVAIGDNQTRKKIIELLGLDSDWFIPVIHSTAVISPTAVIGKGTVVMPQAVVHTGAVVGEHCIINTRAIVEHDNVIGDYTHLSPNATLTGNVSTGEGVHIGASATIIPGMNIGSWSVVGAGSTVIRIIPPYSKAVGSPSRIIQKRMVT